MTKRLLPMATASALPRGFKCLASLVHPQAEYKTADADAGNARHAVKETVINTGDFAELPPVLAERLEAFNNVTAEVAMAIDTATGAARILGRSINRKYEDLAPFEIPGTTDVLAVHYEGDRAVRVLVGDWKGHGAVEHPSENKQTLHNALCAARIYKVADVEVFIQNEGCAPVFYEYDVFELEIFLESLRELQLLAAKAAAAPETFEVEGDHCKYCNAFGACSKKKAQVVDIYSGDMSRRLDILMPLETDDQAQRAYEIRDRLKQMLKRLDAAIHARAAERPIPLKGGVFYGQRETTGNRELDADKTYEVVRELYGQEAADLAVTRETAQTQIDKALRHVGVKPLAPAKKAVLDELEKRGGVARPKRMTFEEFAPTLRAVND